MKTLHTHNLEMDKKFDESFEGISAALNNWAELPFTSEIGKKPLNSIKNFITNSHKQLYIKIAEGEIERLKIKYDSPLVNAYVPEIYDAHNFLIEEELAHWNNILQELNK